MSGSGFYSKSKKLEESYTIQLGAQLKSTHNLRLIRCNIFDFCKDRFAIDETSGFPRSSSTKTNKKKSSETNNCSGGIIVPELEPQAIQTAMSLYSDKLCALILLVENSFSEDTNDYNGSEDNLRNGM